MVFSSTIFLTLFLPIVFGLYCISSLPYRKWLLLLFSLLFYAWGEPKAVICLLVISISNFYIGEIIYRSNNQTAKLVLIVALLGDIGALFFYKYLNFSIANINLVFGTGWKIPGIELPIGISFYCFQCVSYLIDVYKREVEPQRSLSNFMLYVSFFPQLIAGPIVRYIDIKDQLEDRALNLENVYNGLIRFTIGLAKKVLIADPNGFVADKVFALPPQDVSQSWCWIGVICYGLQIYFDFSAYSDMAIGLARVFNFRFLENFKHPYHSFSVQEFWRKWHISLSSWLRDYVYIPLGGSRRGPLHTYMNIWIVFLLCGLWHGAEWTFVLWGAWHGFGLTLERLGLNKVLEYFHPVVRILWVWLFVLVGWVLFRSPDFAYACKFLKNLFGFGNEELSFITNIQLYSNLNISLVLSFFIGLLLMFDYSGTKLYLRITSSVYQSSKIYFIFNLIVAFLFLISVTFAVTSNFSPFIYFRF